MKVQELIAKLEALDYDSVVVVFDGDQSLLEIESIVQEETDYFPTDAEMERKGMVVILKAP